MARQPYWLCALAEAQLAVGDATAALGTLDAARSASAAFDDRFWLPRCCVGHPAARRARRGDAPGGRRAGDGPAEPDAR